MLEQGASYIQQSHLQHVAHFSPFMLRSLTQKLSELILILILDNFLSLRNQKNYDETAV